MSPQATGISTESGQRPSAWSMAPMVPSGGTRREGRFPRQDRDGAAPARYPSRARPAPRGANEEAHVKIVRTSEMAWAEAMNRGHFQQRRKGLGGEKLSCGLWELPPGKRSFPLHAHHVTEEALFVISGRGKVRTPEGEQPI